MGDMTSGGAPRIKSIVAAIQTVANAVLNGNVRTNLRRDDGTEIGTSTNPLVVDIGGDVPDTMDVTKIGGNAVASGSGVADAGTLRVAVATDDVNAAAIKTATEETSATLAAQLDITQSALRDAVQGDLETVQSSLDDVKAATEAIQTNVDVALSTLASESTLDSVKTVVEAITTDVAAITLGVDALKSQATNASTPVVTPATGAGAIAVSYAPGAAFWLDAVTVRLSADPTTSENLDVVLDTADGSDYDITLWSVDPSASTGSKTDFYFVPAHPILCAAGDAITVSFPNTDAATYGVRIVARLA
jgi:hypothetical protein